MPSFVHAGSAMAGDSNRHFEISLPLAVRGAIDYPESSVLLIDRYILIRFIVNFIMLFSLLFVFAVAIDLILHLDDFVDSARTAAGPDGGGLAVAIRLVTL